MVDELGYFADERVEPVFEFGGPNVPHPVQILDGGAADIGFGGLVMIVDSAWQGEEFVMLRHEASAGNSRYQLTGRECDHVCCLDFRQEDRCNTGRHCSASPGR